MKQIVQNEPDPNDKTNPGSFWAVEHGCKCPEMDNSHGRGMPDFTGGRAFWINEDCEMHGKDFIK